MNYKNYIALLFCFTSYLCVAQERNGVLPCEKGLLHDTTAILKKLNTLDDLPVKIRNKMTKHLKNYLGKDFYTLLSFEQGVVYKHEALKPIIYGDSSSVPIYELYFVLKVPPSGIDFCCSRVLFNSVGEVVNEIEFPQKQKGVPNAKFAPKEKILATANALGYQTNTYEIWFNVEGHIVFKFNGLKEKVYSVNTPFVEISVHTGEYVSGIGPMDRYTR